MFTTPIRIGVHGEDDALHVVSFCNSKSLVDPGNIRLVALDKFQGRFPLLAQVVVTADHMDRHKQDVLRHPARVLDHLRKGAPSLWRVPVNVCCPQLIACGKNMLRILARRSIGSKGPLLLRWQSVHSLSPGTYTRGF